MSSNFSAIKTGKLRYLVVGLIDVDGEKHTNLDYRMRHVEIIEPYSGSQAPGGVGATTK